MNIADLGCGAARLGATLKNHNVSSFDLVAANPSVIECDISHVCVVFYFFLGTTKIWKSRRCSLLLVSYGN